MAAPGRLVGLGARVGAAATRTSSLLLPGLILAVVTWMAGVTLGGHDQRLGG